MNGYTEQELITIWQGSGKTRNQMQIMADLNDCTVEDIKEIFDRHDISYPKRERKKPEVKKVEEVKEEKSTAQDMIDKNIVPNYDLIIHAFMNRMAEQQAKIARYERELAEIYSYIKDYDDRKLTLPGRK